MNKGVISRIAPVEEMPVAENGVRADIIVNALGVVNRLNSGQLFEHEINFISDNILAKAKTLETRKEQFDFIMDYIRRINKEQYESLSTFIKENYEDETEYLDVFYERGLYIHQPPFWNNVNIDELMALYDHYDWIQKYNCTVNGKKIENPLIIADLYMMKLKHEPNTKHSSRSTSYLNNKDIPSKNMEYHYKQALCSSTPVRVGEMEQGNLSMAKRPEQVRRLLSMYATSKTNREKLTKTLLTTDNVFDIKEIETEQSKNNNRRVLDVLFKAMGLELED